MHRKANIVKHFLNEIATSATILISIKRYTGRIRTCQRLVRRYIRVNAVRYQVPKP